MTDSPESITLRTLTDADIPAVLVMNNAAVPAVNALALTDLAWFQAEAEAFVVAVEPQGGIVAFLILLDGPSCPYPSENYRWFVDHHREPFLYVDRIVVGASVRGLGTGQLLYRHAIEIGTGRWPALSAEVNLRPRNDASLRFHAAFGFREVGQREHTGGGRLAMLSFDLSAGPSSSTPIDLPRSGAAVGPTPNRRPGLNHRER